jgi:hypothetical protein
MAAIRKLFLALAGVTALTSGTNAFAQVVTQPSPTEIACNTIAVPTLVRVQGRTEQIGDIILTCTGGTPTPTGQAVLTANFAVQTSQPAPGVTSKELSANLPAANGGFPYVESLLAINDPTPAGGAQTPTHYTAGAGPDNTLFMPATTSPVPNACPASNTGACANMGNSNGGGGVNTSYGAAGNFNIFQGYLTSDGVTHFDGIPVDAPGSNQITIRITNIKIDATNLIGFVSTNTESQSQNSAVTASVSITGSTQLGYVLISGLAVAIPANGIYSSQPTVSTSAICTPNGSFAVDVKEGHAAAFKRQNNAVAAVAAGLATAATPTAQDEWGGQYFTESGYYNPALTGINYSNSTGDAVGLATQGTRIYVMYQGIPANTTLYLPTVAYLYGGDTSNVPGWLFGSPSLYTNGAAPSGAAVLVKTDANGAGAFSPIAPTTTVGSLPGVPAQSVGGIMGEAAITTTGSPTYLAVYEVIWSDPKANETLHIPAAVVYVSGAPTYTIPPSYLTATASLAPVSDAKGGVPDVGAFTPADNAYPRFIQGTLTPLQEYYLTGCQCDLLFPYVVDQTGMNTGVAIANTTVDPYGTGPQSGYISLYFYPDVNSKIGTVGTAITEVTTNKVAAGDEFLMVVGGTSTDPGVTAAASTVTGFQGYMIAITGFQFCHGYAFITDGTQAQGYVALVLDELHLSRDGGSGGLWPAPSTVTAERLNN